MQNQSKTLHTAMYYLLILVLAGNVSHAAVETGPMKSPEVTTHRHHADTFDSPHDGYLYDTFSGAMTVYSRVLKPGLSRGCPSYPSCSQYMSQAIARYGPLWGIVIGIERLIHESDEIHHGNFIRIHNHWKVNDPLKNNTFWWDK